MDNVTKYPSLNCPYCGHRDYYHIFFSTDEPKTNLDTNKKCKCGLEYSVKGVTAICPNCVIFNSREIFLEELEKLQEKIVSENSWDNLSDCLLRLISQFDGFGRTTVRFPFFGKKIPNSLKTISFQNLEKANEKINVEFGAEIKRFIKPNDWNLIYKNFQKRHLVSHNLGIVDQEYITKTNDSSAIIGSKITLDQKELLEVIQISKKLAIGIYGYIAS